MPGYGARMRPLRAWLAAAVLVLAACGSSGLPATSGTYDWVVADESNSTTVRLIEPGAEPYEVHRYVLSPGQHGDGTMTFTLDLAQTVGGQTVRVQGTVESRIFVQVVEAVDGAYVLSSTYGTSTVSASDPAFKAELERTYQALEGFTSAQLMSTRGEVLASEPVDVLPESESIGITDAISNATSPLPEEPFGVGAVWETRSVFVTGGTQFIQTGTVRVVDIQGSLLTLEMELVQELGPDGFVIPGLEDADVQVDLLSSGTSSAVWDLEQPLARQAISDVHQDLEATISFAGSTQMFEQVLEFGFRLDGPE